MNKSQLISAITEHTGFTKVDSGRFLDAFCKVVEDSLVANDPVSITGFGKFDISHRKATVGRNPKTGESINIPATKLPKFKPGSVLKEAVSK